MPKVPCDSPALERGGSSRGEPMDVHLWADGGWVGDAGVRSNGFFQTPRVAGSKQAGRCRLFHNSGKRPGIAKQNDGRPATVNARPSDGQHDFVSLHALIFFA